MKPFRALTAAAAAALFVLSAAGQVPVGYVQTTASFITDSSGNPVANGTVSFAPVNNAGQPIGYQVNGKGQAITSPVTTLVTAGAFSIRLADTSLTIPVNVCFLTTVTDNTSGRVILGPGYTCFQPAGSGPMVTSGVCTASTGTAGGTCNFDKFQPNLPGLVVQQTGPTGPQGPQGPQGPPGAPGTAGNPAGSAGALQYNFAGTAFGGTANATLDASGNLNALKFGNNASPLTADAACAAGQYWLAPVAGSTNTWRQCSNGTLSNIGSGSGGGAPTGPAGGDLSGTYPNPSVSKVNGAAIAPNLGCLGSNGTSQIVAGSGCAALITTGLLAQYLFTDGSGTTLTDSSGNGNNCTITGATWTNALWLTFNGNNNYIVCPVSIWTGAQTIEIWFRPRNAIVTPNSGSQILMGSDSANVAQIMSDGAHQGMYGIGAQVGYIGQISQYPEWADKWTGSTSFAITLGTPASLYKLGRKEDVPVIAANLTAFTGTSAFRIGCNAQGGSYCAGFNYWGDIYAIRFLSTALTPQQIAQDESAMETYLLANKGLTFRDQVNYDTSPIVLLGDSLIAGGAPSGAQHANGSIVGVVNSYFPDLETWTFGIASDTANLMQGRATTQVLPLLYRFQGISPVVVMQGGTNDIYNNGSGGANASTLYGYLKTICTTVHSVNAKCVITTVAAANRNTAPMENVRTTLNGLITAGYLSGDLGADAIADEGNDPMIGNNLNSANHYFISDTVHTSETGNIAIYGPRIALGIQSAILPNKPFTLPMLVPRSNLAATSATTGTVNLLQLGHNQKLCGVTVKPVSPSKGGALTAMTFSVGDSLGTTTTYSSATDVFQTPSNTAFQDTATLKSASYAGGVVTGTFTSTGDNVNAAFTDLVTNSTTTISSASYGFTAADVGTDIYISGGTGFTVGSYHISAVAGGVATLRGYSPGASGLSGGTFIVGEVKVDLCVITAI